MNLELQDYFHFSEMYNWTFLYSVFLSQQLACNFVMYLFWYVKYVGFQICGELSSFSDVCSANVITYFPTIYHHLETLEVGDACHLAGVCDELYHFHETTVVSIIKPYA